MLLAMGGSAGSLAGAIASADKGVTVLDDRVDAEDHAAYLWLRAHQLPGYPDHRVVIGTELLSKGWIAKKKKFVDAHSAEVYLHHFDRSHAAMNSLEKLARSLSMNSSGALTKADVVATVGAGLFNGRVWLIELPKRKPKSWFVTKTDPAAFAKINPRYGTKVDFAYIAGLEGDQWLRGYVPMRDGKVVGKSGMTVASGFDIGQWYMEDLKKLGLSEAIMTKITPFKAPNNFKGLSRKDVIAKVAKLGLVPELDKTEADDCDGAVFSFKLGVAISLWDRTRDPGVPAYTALPGGWQTVWLSRVYQGKTGTFGHLARAGKWKEAIAALRADKEYGKRTNQEADLLEKELPAAPAPPVPPARRMP